MSAHTTIVVLATGPAPPRAPAAVRTAALQQPLRRSTVLGTTLRHALATEWPLVVVTTEALAPSLARWVATRDIVALGDDDLRRGRGGSLAAGVAASADADGWVVLPAERPLVRPATLRAVGQALATHAVAYAQHRGRRGEPTGYAAELFSELIALDGDDAPRRLAARYPAAAVEVDDPGVLVDAASQEGMSLARAAAADAA
ncbi:MAG: NTP transferase domain-containing protein [Burkholderiales bacterium]|nr:NTP transferase domain-containing protein [Burkholderiales bacterium]